jgi:hypothetical protein
MRQKVNKGVKHTPTPWKARREDPPERAHDGAFVARHRIIETVPSGIPGTIHRTVATVSEGGGLPHQVARAEEDTAFIVCACNAYDDLVGALRDLLELGRNLVSPAHDTGAVPGKTDHEVMLEAFNVLEQIDQEREQADETAERLPNEKVIYRRTNTITAGDVRRQYRCWRGEDLPEDILLQVQDYLTRGACQGMPLLMTVLEMVLRERGIDPFQTTKTRRGKRTC